MTLRRTLLAVTLASVVVMPMVAESVDRPVPAKSHQVKRYRHGPPSSAKITSKPIPKGSSFVIPTPGGAADPTIHGGTLRFFKIGTTGSWPLHNLRNYRWRGLGIPAGSRGWKYSGTGSIGDPCKSIVIKPNVIRASCRTFLAFSMTSYTMPVSPSPGIGWEMSVGSDRYCAESSTATGAEFRKNLPLIVKAVRANAPPICPVASTLTPTPSPSPTPTPTPTPEPTPTPTPTPPYGSASSAFVMRAPNLLE